MAVSIWRSIVLMRTSLFFLGDCTPRTEALPSMMADLFQPPPTNPMCCCEEMSADFLALNCIFHSGLLGHVLVNGVWPGDATARRPASSIQPRGSARFVAAAA